MEKDLGNRIYTTSQYKYGAVIKELFAFLEKKFPDAYPEEALSQYMLDLRNAGYSAASVFHVKFEPTFTFRMTDNQKLNKILKDGIIMYIEAALGKPFVPKGLNPYLTYRYMNKDMSHRVAALEWMSLSKKKQEKYNHLPPPPTISDISMGIGRLNLQ